MIASGQILAARVPLRWGSARLSESCGVGTATIKRLEVMERVPSEQVRTLLPLERAVETAGADFIVTPTQKPGVCIITKTGPKKP